MKNCGNECLFTTTLDRDTKRRLMRAISGNSKFKDGEIHPQCQSCLAELLANPIDQKFEALKVKLWKMGIKLN